MKQLEHLPKPKAGPRGEEAAGRPDERVVVLVQHPRLVERLGLGDSVRGEGGLLFVGGSQAAHALFMLQLPCVAIIESPSEEDTITLPAESGSTLGLVMGSGFDAEDIKTCVLRGAMGYLDQEAPLPEIQDAVQAVIRGEYWVSRIILSAVVRELMSTPAMSTLTLREMEILQLIPAGHTNRKIADLLGVTYETVRWHLRSIYGKLGVKDRAEAIARAKQTVKSRGRPVLRVEARKNVDP